MRRLLLLVLSVVLMLPAAIFACGYDEWEESVQTFEASDLTEACRGKGVGAVSGSYDDGSSFQAECRAGKALGTFTLRYDNGKINERGELRGGLKQGTWEEHHYDGELAARGAYEAGERHGSWSWWSATGELEKVCEFSRGNQISCRTAAL